MVWMLWEEDDIRYTVGIIQDWACQEQVCSVYNGSEEVGKAWNSFVANEEVDLPAILEANNMESVFTMNPQHYEHPKKMYELVLSKEGLSKRIESQHEEKDPTSPFGKYTYSATKFVGDADLDDFFIFGRYAIRRMPRIPQEITADPIRYSREIPSYISETENAVRPTKTSKLDWERLTKIVSNSFCHLFSKTASERVDAHRERSRIELEKVEGLIRLVSPLKS